MNSHLLRDRPESKETSSQSRNLKRFSGSPRPISAASTATGNSSVFRHTLRVPKTHTLSRTSGRLAVYGGQNALRRQLNGTRLNDFVTRSFGSPLVTQGEPTNFRCLPEGRSASAESPVKTFVARIAKLWLRFRSLQLREQLLEVFLAIVEELRSLSFSKCCGVLVAGSDRLLEPRDRDVGLSLGLIGG